MMTAILTLASLLAPVGNEVRNGGHVVECGSSLTLETLDLHEADLRGFAPLDLDYLENDQIVRHVLARIEARDPERAARFNYFYSLFWRTTTIVADDSLPFVDDFGVAQLRPGCALLQGAVRISRPFAEVMRIAASTWVRLPPTQQAALIMHEIAYGEAHSLGVVRSDDVRAYVGMIFRQDFATVPQAEYDRLASLAFAQ